MGGSIHILINFLRKLVQGRSLIKNLVVRDLRQRYVGSFVGLAWSVVHPIVLLVSYTFVFSVIFHVKLGTETGGTNFPVFLFAGILPWLTFQDTVTRSSTTILENSGLITKTLFPSEFLPLAILVSNLANHLIGLAVLLVVTIGFFHKWSWVLLLVPFILLLLFLFTLGFSWLVSSLNVFLRDTAQLLGILLTFWFWFTPIFFTERFMPGPLRFALRVNPLAHIVSAYRDCILHGQVPSASTWLWMSGLAGIMFLTGALFFRYTKRAFADVL